MAPSGNGGQSQALPDGSGPERAHALPGGHQHRVLPHLRGLLARLRPRGGGRPDTREVRRRVQLPAAPPEGGGSALHLHQQLEGASRHPGEGEDDESGAEGGPEEAAAGVVLRVPAADEGKVHRGHRGEFLQKWMTLRCGVGSGKRLVSCVVCGDV